MDCTKITKGLRKGVVPGDKRNGELQYKLSQLKNKKGQKYYTGKVDNIFGNMTDASVRTYQKDNKLVVDGIAGPITLGKLGLCDKKVVTPTIPNVREPAQEVKRKELLSYVFAQPDAYTCGIASSLMGLSVYDVINPSNYMNSVVVLRKIAGTNTNGTVPENLDASINKFDSRFKMHMEKFENLGTVKKWIDKNVPIILHIGTIPELGYQGYFGHYIIVLGYDYNTNTVKVIDPSRTNYGAKWYHLNVIKKAIERRNHPQPIHPLQKV